MGRLLAIWRAYRSSPLGGRLRTVIRYVLCPFPSILDALPRSGHILDVGCGDGLLALLLAETGSACTIEGVDPDERKIAVAKAASIPGGSFRAVSVADVADASCDCLTVTDVLYLIPLERWREMLDHCARVLRPGGRLVVKEVVDTPRWKYRFIMLEEFLAIRVVGMTKGDRPHIESAGTYRREIEAAGFETVSFTEVGAWRPVAHALFVFEKR